jgi:hypothetical protein
MPAANHRHLLLLRRASYVVALLAALAAGWAPIPQPKARKAPTA